MESWKFIPSYIFSYLCKNHMKMQLFSLSAHFSWNKWSICTSYAPGANGGTATGSLKVSKLCLTFKSSISEQGFICNPHSNLIRSPLFVFVKAHSILWITYAIILWRHHFGRVYFHVSFEMIKFFNPRRHKSRRCKLWPRKCQYLSHQFDTIGQQFNWNASSIRWEVTSFIPLFIYVSSQ